MIVKYARTDLPRSIFLAGPTPRAAHVKSWRPDAIGLLRAYGFDGTVFVPEDSQDSWKFSYDDQVEWELQALHSATVVLFWVPRDFVDMPAMTTNVEFGLFAGRRNVVLGAPESAVRMKYLQSIARLYGLEFHKSLDKTVKAAIELSARPFKTE
jgi:hypothetical protein